MAVLHGKPLAAYLNTVLPKPFPKCLRHRQCVELIKSGQKALSHKTLKRWFLWRWTWDTVNCWNVWTSFILVCLPPPQEVWLFMVGDPHGTRQMGAPWSATPSPWTKTCKDYRGGNPKHWSSVFSAVIREFKHSTSLQDDTSLNSLSTHHPLAHVTWSYDKLFLQTINELPPSLCMNYHAALEPLVTFLYAALFVDIIYLGLYRSKKVFVYDIAEQCWEIVKEFVGDICTLSCACVNPEWILL